jgi:hypothetical protein
LGGIGGRACLLDEGWDNMVWMRRGEGEGQVLV